MPSQFIPRALCSLIGLAAGLLLGLVVEAIADKPGRLRHELESKLAEATKHEALLDAALSASEAARSAAEAKLPTQPVAQASTASEPRLLLGGTDDAAKALAPYLEADFSSIDRRGETLWKSDLYHAGEKVGWIEAVGNRHQWESAAIQISITSERDLDAEIRGAAAVLRAITLRFNSGLADADEWLRAAMLAANQAPAGSHVGQTLNGDEIAVTAILPGMYFITAKPATPPTAATAAAE